MTSTVGGGPGTRTGAPTEAAGGTVGSLWRLPALRAVALYTLFGFAGFFATMAALPAWLSENGAADSVAGLVTTTFLVATIATQSSVPRLVARLGMTPTLAIGAVALGAPALLLLVDGGYAWVVGICVVRGFGFGIVTVLGSLLVARIAPPSRHGEAMGIYGLAIAAPNLIAVAGGVALVTAGLFPIVAILGAAPLLGLVPVWRLRVVGGTTAATPGAAASPPASPSPTTPGRRRQARRAALAPAVVLLVVTLASGGFMTYVPIARADGALATIALLTWGAFGALARWLAGKLADRIGMRALLPGASMLGILGMGIVVGGLVTDGAAGVALILAGATVLGLGFGATQNLTLVAAFRRARQREQATISAVWNIAFDAGTGIGSGLVGLLTAAVSIPTALALTSLPIAASLTLAMRSARLPGARALGATGPSSNDP